MREVRELKELKVGDLCEWVIKGQKKRWMFVYLPKSSATYFPYSGRDSLLIGNIFYLKTLRTTAVFVLFGFGDVLRIYK